MLEREAPGLAEAMRLVNPLGRLSRGIAGTRGPALVLNVPGSPKGAVECLEAVLDVVPHALALLAGDRPPLTQAVDRRRTVGVVRDQSAAVHFATQPNRTQTPLAGLGASPDRRYSPRTRTSRAGPIR